MGVNHHIPTKEAERQRLKQVNSTSLSPFIGMTKKTEYTSQEYGPKIRTRTRRRMKTRGEKNPKTDLEVDRERRRLRRPSKRNKHTSRDNMRRGHYGAKVVSLFLLPAGAELNQGAVAGFLPSGED